MHGVTLDLLGERVKELRRQVHELRDEMADVRFRFGGIEQRFTALGGRFTALERKADRGFADQGEQIGVFREQQDAGSNALLQAGAEIKAALS